MTEELKKDLIAAGANIETALARFMNMEAMYLKFLLRLQRAIRRQRSVPPTR